MLAVQPTKGSSRRTLPRARAHADGTGRRLVAGETDPLLGASAGAAVVTVEDSTT